MHQDGLAVGRPARARGLIFVTPVGCMLTDEGTQLHTTLLEEHRATVDLDAVRVLYDRFLAVNQPTKSKCAEWQRLGDDAEEERFMILSHPQVQEYVQRKAADRGRWLSGMRRLRDKIYGVAAG